MGDLPQIQVIRSGKRRHTVSARMVGDLLVVRIPGGASVEEERGFVERMRQWAERRQRRQARLAGLDDDDLRRRAQVLNERYFGGSLRFTIRYVGNQDGRFGSCSVEGGIRIAHRVASVPGWVRDYVLVHELAHLLVPDHSRAFWRTVERYPLAERARGYLMALGAEPALDDAPDE